jgi:hypothetical protein
LAHSYGGEEEKEVLMDHNQPLSLYLPFFYSTAMRTGYTHRKRERVREKGERERERERFSTKVKPPRAFLSFSLFLFLSLFHLFSIFVVM